MIRPVTLDDLPAAVALGASMHHESYYAHLDYDPIKVMELGVLIVDNPSIYWGVVAEVDGEIVGFGAGYVAPHFFGHDLTSGDLAIFLTPEHRNGMVGVRMIKDYVRWCEERGVKTPALGVSAGIKPERIGKLYERLGFTDKFTIYRRPPVC
jgi:GNAT superfamily N-acetyltransferase